MNRSAPIPARALDELAAALGSLSAAHAELSAALDEQHAAMRRFDAPAMKRLARRQELAHRRILRFEADRRKAAATAARAAGLSHDAPLLAIADAYPERRDALVELRDDLRRRSAAAAASGRRCGRVAGGVLSHLSAALRLVTGSPLYEATGSFAVPPNRPRRVEATG